MLRLITYPDAPAAKDTLRRIPDDRLAGIVNLAPHTSAAEPAFGYVKFGGKLLEPAPAAPVAGEAPVVMIGEQEFEYGFPRTDDTGGMGQDLHPLFDKMRTGRNQVFPALGLNHTDPAGAGWPESFHAAECGHVYSVGAERVKDQVPFAGPDFSSVDFYIDQILRFSVNQDGIELTGIKTFTAAGAYIVHDVVDLPGRSDDSLFGAFQLAQVASVTGYRIYFECPHIQTKTRPAQAVENVLFQLLAEKLQSAHKGVGGSFPKAA